MASATRASLSLVLVQSWSSQRIERMQVILSRNVTAKWRTRPISHLDLKWFDNVVIDGFQDLLWQFLEVMTTGEYGRLGILPGVLDGFRLIKKYLKSRLWNVSSPKIYHYPWCHAVTERQVVWFGQLTPLEMLLFWAILSESGWTSTQSQEESEDFQVKI